MNNRHDPRDRRPTTCCSPAHMTPTRARAQHRNLRRVQCWGYVRKCPVCKTPVCYEDGAADDADNTVPGICDTCALGAEHGPTSTLPPTTTSTAGG